MADTPVAKETDLTGVTAVTIMGAPSGASTQRIIGRGCAGVYNLDTADVDVIFQKDKAGTKTVIQKIVGVVPGGVAIMDKVVILDATDETLEAKLGAAAATTNPKADVSAMETT